MKSMRRVLRKVRHGLKKPPGYILYRIAVEVRAEAERYWGPRRARRFDLPALLRATETISLDELWARLLSNRYVSPTGHVPAAEYDRICPNDRQRILNQAEAALQHRVDLLGSGLIELGKEIDWHKDYKTNLSWPREYCRSIDYMNPERPSDVKFPWEVSRVQWLIPAGQAYLLTGEERYATAAREVIEQWIRSNPYGYGVNWSCTIEVALRILTWTWLFHALGRSGSWSDAKFQRSFLASLFLHAVFTEKHLEKSDINGNHYTADAAGLVFAGMFFRRGPAARRWLKTGWQILCDELPRQVFLDGVDFEGSVPYHRFVLELFLLPALFRQAGDLDVPAFYRERLVSMAKFTLAYSRPDGSVPLWGDADNARALPFGGQQINDHRYLTGVVGCQFAPELEQYFSGSRAEVFWLLGRRAAESLQDSATAQLQPDSAAFREGGFYIMRGARDHVFIDGGPVGFGGRGGHGHNDVLSFEAVLDGVHLITDCGAYVYTADYAARNRFRSTASHNTPMFDGQEINRLVAPDHLWILRNDAQPELRRWETSPERDLFCGAHSGYLRLESSVTPVRTIEVDKRTHTLTVTDTFEGNDTSNIEIPLHLVPGVEILAVAPKGRVTLRAQQREFELLWEPSKGWEVSVEDAVVSPSYGVAVRSKRLVWRSVGSDGRGLRVTLKPHG
jgi:uncharacterized heparinase superfamily protein